MANECDAYFKKYKAIKRCLNVDNIIFIHIKIN